MLTLKLCTENSAVTTQVNLLRDDPLLESSGRPPMPRVAQGLHLDDIEQLLVGAERHLDAKQHRRLPRSRLAVVEERHLPAHLR